MPAQTHAATLARLSLAQAAIRSGYSIELLQALTRRCPKRGQTRLLPAIQEDSATWITSADLDAYTAYLDTPWPARPEGGRPYIPKAIREDVRAECHHECAICGNMNKGELAHIRPVHETFSNSPDNLILLCPNHHTEYDFGHRPSNVEPEVIRAAKLMKRASRKRMLRYEHDVMEQLRDVLAFLRRSRPGLASASSQLRQAYEAELATLIRQIPDLVTQTTKQAAADASLTPADLHTLAPQLGEAARRWLSSPGPEARADLPRVTDELVDIAAPALDDEVPCPHCHGSGWSEGSICPFCGGDRSVPADVVSEYDPADYAPVPCPRCSGTGHRGIGTNACLVCYSSGQLPRAIAIEVDNNDFDDVNCPRCAGSGLENGTGEYCQFCDGDQRMPRDAAATYDPADFDELTCPACDGTGQRGLSGNSCPPCDGTGSVTRVQTDAMHNWDEYLTDCPHCHAAGTSARHGLCEFCGGDQRMSEDAAATYDPVEWSYIDCPACGGSGRRGAREVPCPGCDGDGQVTRVRAEQMYDNG